MSENQLFPKEGHLANSLLYYLVSRSILHIIWTVFLTFKSFYHSPFLPHVSVSGFRLVESFSNKLFHEYRKSWIIWSWSFSRIISALWIRPRVHQAVKKCRHLLNWFLRNITKLFRTTATLCWHVKPCSVWNSHQRSMSLQILRVRSTPLVFSQTLLKKVVVRWTKKYFCTFNLEIITFCCTYISVTGLASDLYLAGTY